MDKEHNHPLLLGDRRHKNDGRRLSKGDALRRSSPSRKKCQTPCKIYLEEDCTNPSCDYWHLPVCQKYKRKSWDANSATSVSSGTLRLTVSPGKSRRQVVGKDLLLFQDFKAFGLRIAGHRAAEIQVDFTEEHEIFGIRSHRSILKSHVAPHKISGKEGSTARSYSQL